MTSPATPMDTEQCTAHLSDRHKIRSSRPSGARPLPPPTYRHPPADLSPETKLRRNDPSSTTGPTGSLDALNDAGPGGRDCWIYDKASEEANELISDHRNGYLPPRPNEPYRYRLESTGVDDRVELTGLGRGGSPMSKREEEGRTPATGGRPSFCVAGRGGKPWTTPTATPGRSAPDKTPAAVSPNTSSEAPTNTERISALMTGDRRRDSSNRGTSGQTDREHLADKTWGYSRYASTGGGIDPIKPPGVREAGPPGNAPSRRPLGPFNHASRTKYRDALSGRNPASSNGAEPASLQTGNSPSWVDIHKNPPTQSRNPLYTTNSPSDAVATGDAAPRKNGMEIRAEYIRQATSMRLKDRSPKLPTPTAVSDDPERPIVSFDSGWHKTDDVQPQAVPHAPGSALIPSIGVSPPASGNDDGDARDTFTMPDFVEIVQDLQDGSSRSAPAVALPFVPQIQISMAESTPEIRIDHHPGHQRALPDPADAGPKARQDASRTAVSTSTGLPQARGRQQSARRPLPAPTPSTSGLGQWRHNSDYRSAPIAHNKKDSAACHECSRSIQGRFVRLAGSPEHFHPQCFSCVVCGTSLEALEIHAEPEDYRRERLDRIRRRAAGHILNEEPGKTMAEDGDERLRFYCHLDWHELFAPRCKHCKTPILGDHIIALGAHWHQGHFFCAECGDPFGSDMTHIEKDGYAWCIKCQTTMTERRAPKCKQCKEAVIGSYVVAMGGEWHEKCFRCSSCNNTFDDGQIFPKTTADRGTMVLCTRCRATELKH